MIITPSMIKLKEQMFRHATSNYQVYDGRHPESPYFRKAKRVHEKSGTMLIFTRDVDMHKSGWFKNPDYDKCFHLSLSFWDIENSIPAPFENKLAAIWVDVFYGDNKRYVWEEGPSGLIEVPVEVHHYRVMVNDAWKPIIPRKEVYSREFTEKGWKSFSDLKYDTSPLYPAGLD